MAQKGGKRKQAPAYSADTMALRYIAGLALGALGVMIFMAVVLNMSGTIFQGLRQVCFGTCGSMAYILAALPLWAGGLVIWSTQRRAPVRPWVFATLSFIGICTFIMLISGNAMEVLDKSQQGNWIGVIGKVYTDCITQLQNGRNAFGGGALGAMLAWPLWKFLGTVLGIVLILPATVFCLLMAVNLTPRRIRDLITGQAGARKAQQAEERRIAEAQQMAWQQQQAMQQQAWQQQQQYILEQQQQQQQQQTPQYRPPAAQGVQAQGMNPQYSVEQWQEQTARQTAANAQKGHKSTILTARTPAAEPKAGRSWKSRIFGNRKEEYDGLVGDPADSEAAVPGVAARKPARRTATGAEIGTPGTRWNTAGAAAGETPARPQRTRPAQPAEAAENAEADRPVQTVVSGVGEEAPAARTTAARNRDASQRPTGQTEQEPAAQNRDAYRRPAGKTEEAAAAQNRDAYRRPAGQTEQESAAQNRDAYRRPAGQAEQEPAAQNRDAYRRPAEQAEDRRTAAERPAPEKPGPRRPKVPAVQQEIGKESFTPELNLKPSEKAPHTPEEEEWFPIPYNYPPITDLAMPQPKTGDTAGEDEARSRKLEETLASFKVQARVVHVTHGPAISRFEMELAAGTKVNKVAELEKDIAYGMEATSIRIEAPIPGKSLVGVEVPNRKVETVTLREVLESDRMQNAKSLLTVALGKDLTGTPIVCDLAKMPHMLIAGQTGSGKSVCINAIINSLLYRAGPDEVKLILVDPKVVELQCYNGIPHLLIPVVNDPHKAAAALAWAVAEMMERYDKFAERKVRNLDGYNASLKPHEKPMTRIVIIIDELADLMMVCKKDVEEYICRLTQLARAAGIHLIVATQRPSVDVITGLIKANIPSRIAFKTASYVDSRTILDRNGSEQLLGWGDMLYLPTGAFAPTRVQGCFLSDEEVNRIVKHVKDANPSTYDPDILEKVEEIASGGNTESTGADMIGGDMGGGDGSLFDQAVEFAIADGQISTSTLQRRLKIGYARAGRLTDEMEERGIVAAKDGSKPRKCLITREQWEEMKNETA